MFHWKNRYLTGLDRPGPERPACKVHCVHLVSCSPPMKCSALKTPENTITSIFLIY